MTRSVAKANVKLPNGLLPQQDQFVAAFMANGRNAKQAAISAGYNKGSAASLTRNPLIVAEINRRIEEYTRLCGIDRMEVLTTMWKGFKADPTELFAPGGGILPPDQWPEDVKILVEGYNAGTVTAAEKITIASRIDLGFKLLEATGQMPDKKVKVEHTHRAEVDFDEIVRTLRGAPRVIDVTPQ